MLVLRMHIFIPHGQYALPRLVDPPVEVWFWWSSAPLDPTSVRPIIYRIRLETTESVSRSIMSAEAFKVPMNLAELGQLLKSYFAAKFGSVLDYFVIEGRMSLDATGDAGVTGTCRKRAADKNVFFTVTVNVPLGTIQNLQEYS